MPDWLQAVILGALQGLTEFLPVSSSGHLVLFQEWLGEDFFASEDALFFDLVLHVGTLLPVLWFYRADLGRILSSPKASPSISQAGGLLPWLKAEPWRWFATLVVIASVPTAAIGVLLEDHFERLFSSVTPVCIALVVTGALLFATRFVKSPEPGQAPRMSGWIALLLGVVQGAAITPGISRSGSTIAAALFCGVDREQAARFSFLMSVPAILGAVVFKARDGIPTGDIDWISVAAGFVTALLVGYGALVLLVAIVKRGGLHRFAWYVWPLAGVAWIAFAVG
jgi:undecaprenyl-diphosphatase